MKTNRFFPIITTFALACITACGSTQAENTSRPPSQDSLKQVNEANALKAKEDTTQARSVVEAMTPDSIDFAERAKLGSAENILLAETCLLLEQQKRLSEISTWRDTTPFVVAQVTRADVAKAVASASRQAATNLVKITAFPRATRQKYAGECRHAVTSGEGIFDAIVSNLKNANATSESVGTSAEKLRIFVRDDIKAEIAELYVLVAQGDTVVIGRGEGQTSPSGEVARIAQRFVCEEWKFTPAEIGLKEVPKCATGDRG